MDQENRVIVLIDMDCFYCQVEEKLNPELKGKPIAVVQYNPWKGGGIIAVNYVARAMGVTRHMRGDEAKEKCPEIQLPSVPCSRGKADITKYRDAGKDVAKVLQKYTALLERASIDEAYLDITAPVQERLKSLNVNTIDTYMIPNTYALGYDSVESFLEDVHTCASESIEFDYDHAKRLLIGAVIVSEIRAAVYEDTGYRCSAGIAHNKILAKLVCGMNKPNKQTVLPKHSINILYKTLPIKKVKHLGGKFGDTVCEILKISKMAELQMFTEKDLQSKFDEKNGSWLYSIARGTDLEPVKARFNPKSIGCCKQFRGKSALLDLDSLKKWLRDLGDEIEDRLEKDALENNRTPKQMVLSFSTQLSNGRDTSSSRSYNFVCEDELCGELFSNKALELLMESTEGVKPKDGDSNKKLKAPIKFLGISVGKFEDNSEIKKTKKIKDYFSTELSKDMPEKAKDTEKHSPKNDSKKDYGKEYILQKFFQVSDKIQVDKTKHDSNQKNTDTVIKDPTFESSLEKQESFFVKMLNRKPDKDTISVKSDSAINVAQTNIKTVPGTPVCEVINYGDDSNDTEYSGSTINMEINKSIALFEDVPQDLNRVNNIRQLLNNSNIVYENEHEPDPEEITTAMPDMNIQKSSKLENLETFDCSECGKTVSIDMFEMHADYHFALKLRNEERHQTQRETKDKNNQNTLHEDKKKRKSPKDQSIKNDLKNDLSVPSIANFFVKVDDSIPAEICSYCGKKVPLPKFPEHLDFHEAQRLSRELNKKPTSSITANSVKRKRKSPSDTKKQKLPKCKSIESFFR